MKNTGEAAPSVAVMFEGAAAPKKFRARWYHYIGGFFYNLARKPKVWRWRREQDQVYAKVLEALRQEVLPCLYQVRLTCPQCRNTYGTLKTQPYLSSVRMILKNMQCEDHPEPYREFLLKYGPDFDQSDKLAAWINGFDA